MELEVDEWLRGFLQKNSLPVDPEIVIAGSMPSALRGLPFESLGEGISVVVGYKNDWAHVFGRRTLRKGKGLLGNDQIILRQYSYVDCESVRVSRLHDAGAVVTLILGSKGGLLQQAVAGGDVVLVLSESALEEQQHVLDLLQTRVREAHKTA